MSYGDTKIVINSITYDNHSNNILVGVRKHAETEDSQMAEVVLDNSDKRFTALNLEGLTAVLSYDYGAGYVATPTLRVVTQDDITSGGNYQTVLNLVGIPDLLSEDKASADYEHFDSSAKTVKDMLTEVLDGTAVTETLQEIQTTNNGDYWLSSETSQATQVGQRLWIHNRTVSKITFRLYKYGSPTGNITYIIKSTDEATTYATKVLGNASALDGTPTDYQVTLDTPVTINDEVFILCDFGGGDAVNRVLVRVNAASVKVNEYAVKLEGSTYTNYPEADCYYKYTYTGGGIGVFSHCTSITATYDSEDSLIDAYQPKGTFKISEGESRQDVVNRLLDYTGCYKRAENDDEVHIFTKPASGNSYNSDKGEFYNNANRKALVIPNKIVVKSYDDDDGYEGSYTSAASYALVPITGAPVRAYVSSNAQAIAVATALIGRLEINSQVGSALVPMDNYEQVWNYVTVTNNWNGSTTTGNIAYVNRVSMGGEFEQFFSFGRQAKRGIAGMAPKREVKLQPELGMLIDSSVLKWGDVKGVFDIIDENTDDIYEKLNIIFAVLDAMGVDIEFLDRGVSFTWVNDTILNNLSSYYTRGETDDLIADIDLTAVSSSAPSRVLNTVYQNTSGKIRIVTVSVQMVAQGVIAYTGATSSPATIVGIDSGADSDYGCVTFVVQPDWYYKVVCASGSGMYWHEWDLL